MSILNKLKHFISERKQYIDILSDFEELNNYVFNSSIFLNRLELILYSEELTLQQKLDNITLSYSDFKVTTLENNFNNGVEVDNVFDI